MQDAALYSAASLIIPRLCAQGVEVGDRLVGGPQGHRGVHPQRLHPGHRQEQTLHLHRGMCWQPGQKDSSQHVTGNMKYVFCRFMFMMSFCSSIMELQVLLFSSNSFLCSFLLRTSSSSAVPTTGWSSTRSETPSSRGSSEHTSMFLHLQLVFECVFIVWSSEC